MVSARSISRLKRIDWDFSGIQSESAFSAVHWYPCRFVSQIPAAFIGTLSEPGDLVLDPFAGSGTTLVEAQRLGRRSIGVDLNPIACAAARAKTLASYSRSIARSIESLENDVHEILDEGLLAAHALDIGTEFPVGVQHSKWYTRRVFRDLRKLWNLIRTDRGNRADISVAAFSAILLKVCRETRHWGYVCDNTTPKSDHEGNVEAEFIATVSRFRYAYEQRDRELLARFGENYVIASSEVLHGDSRTSLESVAESSVDLVVTSPPYYGVSDYIKAQRLSMEWFGFEIEPFRREEIGARSKRHRQDAREQYLADIGHVFVAVRRSMRNGGACVVVLGESRSRDTYVEAFQEKVKATGFELLHSADRKVAAQRRLTPSILNEKILVFAARK
jgi:DNA modification methylase